MSVDEKIHEVFTGYVPFSVRYGIAFRVLAAGFRKQPASPKEQA